MSAPAGRRAPQPEHLPALDAHPGASSRRTHPGADRPADGRWAPYADRRSDDQRPARSRPCPPGRPDVPPRRGTGCLRPRQIGRRARRTGGAHRTVRCPSCCAQRRPRARCAVLPVRRPRAQGAHRPRGARCCCRPVVHGRHRYRTRARARRGPRSCRPPDGSAARPRPRALPVPSPAPPHGGRPHPGARRHDRPQPAGRRSRCVRRHRPDAHCSPGGRPGGRPCRRAVLARLPPAEEKGREMRRGPTTKWLTLVKECPATSYSPTQSPVQYHRR